MSRTPRTVGRPGAGDDDEADAEQDRGEAAGEGHVGDGEADRDEDPAVRAPERSPGAPRSRRGRARPRPPRRASPGARPSRRPSGPAAATPPATRPRRRARRPRGATSPARSRRAGRGLGGEVVVGAGAEYARASGAAGRPARPSRRAARRRRPPSNSSRLSRRRAKRNEALPADALSLAAPSSPVLARRTAASMRASTDRGLRAGRAGQQDAELVAAEASDEVLAADRALDRVGDAAQHAVACRVAVDVVDALEPVEVEEPDRGSSPWRRARAVSDAARTSNARRLAMPVSESCIASVCRRLVASRARLRACWSGAEDHGADQGAQRPALEALDERRVEVVDDGQAGGDHDEREHARAPLLAGAEDSRPWRRGRRRRRSTATRSPASSRSPARSGGSRRRSEAAPSAGRAAPTAAAGTRSRSPPDADASAAATAWPASPARRST